MNSTVLKRSLKELSLFAALMAVMLAFSAWIGNAHHAMALTVLDQADDPVKDLSGGATDIKDLVLKILKFALSFLGIVAVIMVIYGGFLYVTAAGDDDKVGTGKKIITYSIVGIIIIMISFALINTVLQAGTGGTTGV